MVRRVVLAVLALAVMLLVAAWADAFLNDDFCTSASLEEGSSFGETGPWLPARTDCTIEHVDGTREVVRGSTEVWWSAMGWQLALALALLVPMRWYWRVLVGSVASAAAILVVFL